MITKAKKMGKGYSMLVVLLLVMLISPLQQLITNAKSGQISPPLTESYWTDVRVAPSGSGTRADPYIIDSAEKLAYLVGDDQWGYRQAYFSQTKDIDLGGKKWKTIGNLTASANTINYNGNGYKISNMTIVDGENHRGLFGYVWNGTIENVNIVNPYIIGGSEVGGLAANLEQSWVRNCHVSGGYLEGELVGGLVGVYAAYTGTVVNVSSSASVYASDAGGGIIGMFKNHASAATTHLIQNAYVAGMVESAKNAGGIIGEMLNCARTDVGFALDNCYSEATLRATSNAGGIVASIGEGDSVVVVQKCGFNGDIIAQANTKVGSMIAEVAGFVRVTESFGIADVKGGTILQFGAENVTWGDCFSYTRQSKDGKLRTFSKYKNIEGMKNFKYNPYINGGYPFPTGMFAVGGVLPEQDVIGYLQSFNFNSILSLEIKTLENSTYGTDKYVEFGKYPQTYVGSSMNTSLENWYSGKTVVDTYTVDNGTSATPNVYNAYTYTNGKTYVRVPTPSLYSTSYTYQDGTAVSTNATWFEIEPIRWLILNYTDVQNGASPIVVAEKGLTAKVTWNKDQAFENLWSGTSNIRTWLNGTFYNDTFGSDEKGNIVNTTLQNNSQSSNTDGTGVSTTDNVWLLSYDEVNGKYFTTSVQRLASPTDFAIANYCYVYTNNSYPTTARPNGGTCSFWLRSANPSRTTDVRVVLSTAYLNSYYVDYIYCAVRPALTLNI